MFVCVTVSLCQCNKNEITKCSNSIIAVECFFLFIVKRYEYSITIANKLYHKITVTHSSKHNIILAFQIIYLYYMVNINCFQLFFLRTEFYFNFKKQTRNKFVLKSLDWFIWKAIFSSNKIANHNILFNISIFLVDNEMSF